MVAGPDPRVTPLTAPEVRGADMRVGCRLAAAADALLLAACPMGARPPPDPEAALVARGEQIFFEETFDGNGRTCATCHRAEENFSIGLAFIATLPDDDALFVAEFDPDLAKNFEKPEPPHGGWRRRFPWGFDRSLLTGPRKAASPDHLLPCE